MTNKKYENLQVKLDEYRDKLVSEIEGKLYLQDIETLEKILEEIL
jgi:hypothetical protein